MPGREECVLAVSKEGVDGKRRFATLKGAVEAARKMRGPSPSMPGRILVEGGTYFLEETLRLDARDNGLLLEGEPGGGTVLCGGRRIAGWRPESDHLWAADVPEAKGGAWNFRSLAVNGEWRPRARLPEEDGYLHRNEADPAAPWHREVRDKYADYTALACDPADIGPGFDAANAEVRVYHAWDESLVDVAGYDPETGVMTLRQPCIYPPGTFGRHEYVVFNTREGLTRPGQWFLDRVAGKLVYRPLPGEDMASLEAVAPALESIVHIQGAPGNPAREIVIRNLTFTSTRSLLTNEKLLDTPEDERGMSMGVGGRNSEGAVSLRRAEDCVLAGLTFRRVGGHAVKGLDAPKCRVVGCDFADIGSHAVLLADAPDADIANNRILGVGRLFPSANAVAASKSDHVAVRHNEIGDAPYSGVSLSRSMFANVCSNLIHHVMQEITDGGGIYIDYGKYAVVKGNHVSDFSVSSRYKRNLRHAYYFDVGCQHCLLEGNLAQRCRSFSHVHMADQIAIRNNVFISDGPAVDGGGGLEVSFRRSADCLFERNVVQTVGDIVIHDAELQVVRKNVLFSRNGRIVAVSTREPGKDECELRIEADNVFDDPAVEEEREGLFRASAEGLAEALDLAPVNVSTVGPQAKLTPQHFTFTEDVREARRRIGPMLIEGMKKAAAGEGA